ncbi:MAG: SprB repeat-containing protein, partial [Flavobacteriales bacterium]|nr:SprB repeat-containing protein [Flavobacteriales bacterium]
MKKVLFGATLAALMSFSNLVQAQITITLADFAAIGDTVIDLYDTLVPSGTTVGGTGNQTWDYSSLQLDYMDTTYFVDPSTTTNGADFPSASLASGADDFYIYLEANTNGVFFSGLAADFFGTGVPSSLVYAPVQKVMEFPSTDGTGYNDTSGYKWRFSGADVGAPIDSIGVYHTSYFTSIVDAYGTVTTPSGTYQTIRQYTMEITYDSVMMNDPAFTGGVWQLLDPALIGAPNPTIDTSYNYHWFANGEDAPVLEMQTDGPAGNVLEANFKLGTKLLAVAIASSDVSCFGDCDGSLEVAALSGTAPFAYSWDDPTAQTTATATGLCPGNYQVTIIDGINDTAIAMFTVGEPDSLAIAIFGTNPSCDTCPDGWVSATVSGGTLPFVYAWNDPSSQTGSSATNLMNGTFSVVVTDTNGCTI